jgi:hypothetical protein
MVTQGEMEQREPLDFQERREILVLRVQMERKVHLEIKERRAGRVAWGSMVIEG